jgi:glyoxalase family protein
MPEPGTIRGTHHLTFCVGGAQEDYDFHVGVLGLRCMKKTVLFDGELPIYHLYYGNEHGDGSTLLTSFPYRQAGWVGKRGSNQIKVLDLAVPADALGFWADRVASSGIPCSETERFGAQRLAFKHPCGIDYSLVGTTGPDPRTPWEGSGVGAEHAIRGAHGTTTSVREAGPMASFITDGLGGEHVASEGPHHQFRIGTDEGQGRLLELVEEPDLPQGTWHFGEGTIHHHALDVGSAESQAAVKDRIVGLGYTDASEPKDRGYFMSVYCRSPGGALIELAYSTPEGFLIDESAAELGTHLCIPPHWEHRRAEIAQLEPLETAEPLVGS